MTLYKFSTTAATNADADSTINFREGQAPSTFNNSARALMAAIAKYRDDLAANIATGGTATAYTLTTAQVYTALTDGIIVGFVPHATNNASATLAVDGLTAKPLRIQTATAIPAGALVAGTPYVATYNSSADEFRVHGIPAVGAQVPIGAMMPYAATTGSAPNSSYAFPYGQAVSRTTYATLFALLSTSYGTGNGSTTFNLPDLRGRVIAGYDSMGGSSANRLTGLSGGVNGDTIGATGGAETHTLTAGQLAANIPATVTTTTVTTVTPNESIGADGVANGNWASGGGGASRTVQQIKLATGNLDTLIPSYSASSASSSSASVNPSGGAAHNNVQPTIIIPWLIRVL